MSLRALVFLATLLCLGPAFAEAPPGTVEAARTARFVFHATEEARGTASHLAGAVEVLRDRIADDLGQDYPGVSEIRVAHDARSFRALQPGGRVVPSWAAGIAYPALNLVVLNTSGGPRRAEPDRVLAHEISHLALGRLAPERLPRWFLEGMATYHAEEWDFGRAAVLAHAVARDRLIPIRDLNEGWPSDPADVQTAYAQSIAFVSWLFREHGRPAVRSLVAAALEGRPFDRALEDATDTPLWRLEREFEEDLSLRYTWLPALTSTGFLWALVSLLFLGIWLRQRQLRRRRLARLAELEAMEADEAEAVIADVIPLHPPPPSPGSAGER